MGQITLQWTDITKENWDKLLGTIPRSNAFQDWSFAENIKKIQKIDVQRAIILNDSREIGLVQIFGIRHFKLLTQYKIIRGPLFNEPPLPIELDYIFSQIKSNFSIFRGQLFSITPELPNTDSVNMVMRKAGLNKIMAGYDSIWLDLRKSEKTLRQNLHGKWRNQLSKSESESFRLQYNNKQDLEWLTTNNQRFQTLKGFTSIPNHVFSTLPVENKIIICCYHENNPIAATLFHLHGNEATYQLSYFTPESRPLNAGNYLMWQSLLYLKQKGIRHLDLGGIDIEKSPDIARFKSRLGGESFTLTGTYI